MASGKRPEHRAPPEIYYGVEEAVKYTSNSRMIQIQQQLSERAIELLNLPEDQYCYVLDIGCGSGLSGECLTEQGHEWLGLDISTAMLDVAVERECEGDLIHGDMGHGMPFRPGTFDGAISISAIQWLCNADKKTHHPPRRLYAFFCTLYAVLARGGRAVLQLYPENSDQLELITQQAMRSGFTGGLVIDYPNSTKAKKIFLCLFAGGGTQVLPKGLGTDVGDTGRPNQVTYNSRREKMKTIRRKASKSRDWILEKKERRRRQGRSVRPDSKYTARKRSGKF